jgi:hypothetical protein
MSHLQRSEEFPDTLITSFDSSHSLRKEQRHAINNLKHITTMRRKNDG